MTADVDLLPLPEEEWNVRYGYDADAMQSYARANVEHHNAAKDAEIERLRGEVERLTSMARMQAARADAAEREASHRKTRAERLAEALREWLGAGNAEPAHVTIDRTRRTMALLHPTAAQENKSNG